MRTGTILGIVLIVLGVFSFAYAGSVTRPTKSCWILDRSKRQKRKRIRHHYRLSSALCSWSEASSWFSQGNNHKELLKAVNPSNNLSGSPASRGEGKTRLPLPYLLIKRFDDE